MENVRLFNLPSHYSCQQFKVQFFGVVCQVAGSISSLRMSVCWFEFVVIFVLCIVHDRRLTFETFVAKYWNRLVVCSYSNDDSYRYKDGLKLDSQYGSQNGKIVVDHYEQISTSETL